MVQLDHGLLAAVVYSGLGLAMLCVGFWLIDKLTPGSLWKELLENQNIALAIVAAGFAISLGLIIASAIH